MSLASSRARVTLSRHHNSYAGALSRTLSTQASLRRSYLYVPSSSERMLEKSVTSGSDVVIYDLEDSVSPLPEDKAAARSRLRAFLQGEMHRLYPLNVAARVNSISTPYFHEDICQIVSQPVVRTVILPKIHSAADIDVVSDAISGSRPADAPVMEIIPSIESAKGMWNLGAIAAWKSSHGGPGGNLGALLFAAEDYCADTSIIRTSSRRELLFTRSQIVIAAKAFGLDAIDMVCINYRNTDVLKDECQEGRQFGFTGKQAIHPNQVELINKTFVPTQDEIALAARILSAMHNAHASKKGAVGLDGKMIDAPMIRQAERVMQVAKYAGLDIPSL
ncbi:unnamed protein product [Cyclocybe aegerita]|uniref:HpcH/HpaI aldolase/citrate lyase domain-containing protein n=1 Tax=Cyclocybe aegerita TaxID=1973307 RepID=A0A8S0W3X8_CYCAE|nr:unnamed protein product [Cyclocybe aegerita]